jgi:hypothetical protein
MQRESYEKRDLQIRVDTRSTKKKTKKRGGKRKAQARRKDNDSTESAG